MNRIKEKNLDEEQIELITGKTFTHVLNNYTHKELFRLSALMDMLRGGF